MSDILVSYEDEYGNVYDLYRVIREAFKELPYEKFRSLHNETFLTAQSVRDMTDEIINAFVQDTYNFDCGYMTEHGFNHKWKNIQNLLEVDMSAQSMMTKLARGYFTYPETGGE